MFKVVLKKVPNYQFPELKNIQLKNFSFIDFVDINKINELRVGEENVNSNVIPKTLDLLIDLEINDNALIDITLDPETGSYLVEEVLVTL